MKTIKQLSLAVLGFIGTVGIVGASLLAGGRVAEASNEFPPNPSVEMSLSCKPTLIGDLHVTYKNDGGLSDAEFTTVIDGVTQAHVSLDAAIWGEVHYPLPEGSPGVVTISAPGMTTVNTTLGPVDCFDATMHTEVVCINGTPTISVTATNTGKLEDDYILALLNSPWFNEQAAIGVGGSKTFTQTLSEGAEEIAYLYSNHTGLIGVQSGSATCDVRPPPHRRRFQRRLQRRRRSPRQRRPSPPRRLPWSSTHRRRRQWLLAYQSRCSCRRRARPPR